MTYTTNAELQPRGNGIVETVKEPVYAGTHSIKLRIPEDYTMGDAARISVPIENITLNDVTTISYCCFIDESTPLNQDGTYWVPYITFEIDTDGKPGCDTWVIGGKGSVIQEPGAWFEVSLEKEWLFHVPTTVADYASPFSISNMGTLEQVRSAIGPDGKTSLGDLPVTAIRLAIGNWGPGGPIGPVICYVDQLEYNENILLK
ncbi:MAG: hypothetical protein JSU79_06025 [Dehalococcoidales bacterium]|nr:MAG: hypothetical protein JSU79_06025 [Dehalococcoidales bacterium]